MTPRCTAPIPRRPEIFDLESKHADPNMAIWIHLGQTFRTSRAGDVLANIIIKPLNNNWVGITLGHQGSKSKDFQTFVNYWPNWSCWSCRHEKVLLDFSEVTRVGGIWRHLKPQLKDFRTSANYTRIII